MNKLFLSLIMLSLLTLSCSEKDDPEINDFTGTWTGVYLGNEDNGTWTATIDSNGDVTGSASSSVYSQSYDLVGTIDEEGAFTATAGSASTGTEFIGQFSDETASGTWSNTTLGISGTWSGSYYGDPL